MLDAMEEIPYTSVKAVQERDPNEQRTGQVDSPRSILRTREASQEHALPLAKHLFASVNGNNEVVTLEIPEEVPTVTTRWTTLASTTAITTSVPATSATTTTIGVEAGSPRTFLPNGSPSRPTMTAKCRPQMWVQRVSEG